MRGDRGGRCAANHQMARQEGRFSGVGHLANAGRNDLRLRRENELGAIFDRLAAFVDENVLRSSADIDRQNPERRSVMIVVRIMIVIVIVRMAHSRGFSLFSNWYARQLMKCRFEQEWCLRASGDLSISHPRTGLGCRGARRQRRAQRRRIAWPLRIARYAWSPRSRSTWS